MTVALRRTRSRHRQKYYGVQIVNEGLYNNRIGGPNEDALAFAERIDHSGTLTNIAVYCITGVGYSAGTGGSVLCRVETDDGAGNPSGTLVSAGAFVTITTPNSAAIREFNFSTPPVLDSGQMVFFVFTNADPNPIANYISIDLIDISGYQQPQPTLPYSYRYALWYQSSPPWQSGLPYFYPILRLLYADGTKHGQCTYENGIPQYIGGLQKVRENIQPTVNLTVTRISVCVARLAGTAAPLVVNMKNLTTGGTLIDSGSIPASSIHIGDNVRYGCQYVGYTPASPITISIGTNYSLELTSTETANRYMTASSRHGGVPASFGALLNATTQYTDGVFQYSSDGTTFTSVDTDQSHVQFYFDVAS